ncbi:hypothetical protein RHO13_12155 [Orbus wheelerorum]|uniref:hypothetical protein n=1 Tax=Orbus wheelerorum TaxID=3074111 RepID=UPI00370D778B
MQILKIRNLLINKKFLIVILLLIIVSIIIFFPVNKKTIGIYTYDGRYACNGPRYIVFRMEEVTENEFTKIASIIDEKEYIRFNKEISDAVIIDEENDSKDCANKKDITIGSIIDIEFRNKITEKLFEKDTLDGLATYCFFVYFEGEPSSNSFFIVDRYQLIQFPPKSNSCFDDALSYQKELNIDSD